MQLKRVSEKEREFLSLLGETPQQHQKQLLEKEYKQKHSTNKEINVHELNRKVESAITSKTPLSEAINKMEFSARPQIHWKPNKYVLSLQETICTNCGSKEISVSSFGLLLEQVPIKPDGLNSKLYTPVKDVYFKKLERTTEINKLEIALCPHCIFSESTTEMIHTISQMAVAYAQSAGVPGEDL